MVELKYIGKKSFVFKNTNLRQSETEFLPGKWTKMPRQDAEWMLKYNGNIFGGMRDFVQEEIPEVVPEVVEAKEELFKCSVCGKEYTSEYFYKAHMEKKHPVKKQENWNSFK